MANKPMWQIEITHQGLNKYRHIKGSDKYVVEQIAHSQQLIWDEMWKKKLESERKQQERNNRYRSKEQKKELASIKTNDANLQITQLETILIQTLNINDAIKWDELLNKQQFSGKAPITPTIGKPYGKPEITDLKYKPKIGIVDNLLPKSKQKKINESTSLFEADLKSWEADVEQLNKRKIAFEKEYQENLKKWEESKANFNLQKNEDNLKVLNKKKQYEKGEPEAILDYCEMVLTNSVYPDYFPQEWNIDYEQNSKILIIDYSLPNLDSLPKIKSVKYIATSDTFSESLISTSALTKLYDDVLYQITLRTIHELYEADVINAIDIIVFNGWVDSIDKSTGHNTNACILSVSTSKDEFLAINLENVEPKACFKQLKGVGSSKLHGLTPIAPIMSINKEDKRFVSSYGVVDNLDESVNIAAMDWQDFENLIREVFEKEFLVSGGEVKITQASRDGGVDAIAFDPDPIRGGKIVIQAKRYTNVVGVSAVRDLYGTTLNEGATKGILVTTANYGPDAYDFAKGKPLTLLNGSNLLHLLEKHGHKAKIDLKAAKLILNEQT
jgi:restriction system protein